MEEFRFKFGSRAKAKWVVLDSHQAFLSSAISGSFPKLVSIESVMPSNLYLKKKEEYKDE